MEDVRIEKSGLYKTSDLYIAAWLLSKGLKPTMDNGFGGREYEIDKKNRKVTNTIKQHPRTVK